MCGTTGAFAAVLDDGIVVTSGLVANTQVVQASGSAGEGPEGKDALVVKSRLVRAKQTELIGSLREGGSRGPGTRDSSKIFREA